MKHVLTVACATIALALGVTGTLVVAQNARTPEVLFKAAQHAEEVQGDLKAAIEQYEKVVAAGSRALVGQALVRMAECYQKLGDAEAGKLYERILREYADQKEAVAVARARLTGSDRAAPGGGVALRRVWSDDNVEDLAFIGGISPDGRYLSYAGRYNTAVIVRDLVTGAQRVLNSGEWGTIASAISKDGSQVAYDKWAGTTGELWASPFGSGSLSPREAFERLPVPTAWPSPLGSGSLPTARSLFANDDVVGIQPHDCLTAGALPSPSGGRTRPCRLDGWPSPTARSAC